jgi:hypothetical protein
VVAVNEPTTGGRVDLVVLDSVSFDSEANSLSVLPYKFATCCYSWEADFLEIALFAFVS